MIPKQIHGLPVHPLAVHAPVVLIPLAVLLAILFVIPRTRAWAALPMAVVAVGALISVEVARLSGFNFKAHFAALGGKAFSKSLIGRLIASHESKANVLYYLMIVFAIVAVVVYLLWRRPQWSPVKAEFTGVLQYIACGVLVLGAIVIAVQVYRVGEAGSKIVWNPDGTQSYNSSAVLTPR